ncbi:MAG: ATPase, partial [Methanobacteriaceae archaeon]|nr:ATPase [Methanobacteriaceae archaeon]
MDLDFLANFANNTPKEELSYNKKDIMKILKRIGVDTRFVSYFEDEDSIKLYVENFRFSKFSKTRVINFNNYYKDIEVIRSSLFQKICLRASKVLANSLKPKTKVLIPS